MKKREEEEYDDEEEEGEEEEEEEEEQGHKATSAIAEQLIPITQVLPFLLRELLCLCICCFVMLCVLSVYLCLSLCVCVSVSFVSLWCMRIERWELHLGAMRTETNSKERERQR